MSAEAGEAVDSKFEIGHVLFLDIVGYSKLLIEEQKERLNQLTAIVLATKPVRDASDEQLVKLPTGDGMALVFRHSAEEPARCALGIAEALRKHPELPVRMGIHSGPVSEVTDVSGRKNIAGAGINMAQRVMDCGDAGHILVSQHVADDLMQYRQWAPRFRDLGDCEVKHGVRLHLVNLYAEPLGNPELPAKLKAVASAASGAKAKPKRMPLYALGITLMFVAVLLTGAFLFWRARTPSRLESEAAGTPHPENLAGTRPPMTDKSVAVLPFQNLSKEEENAFFADGVQDQILTALAKVADLKVISRTSVMQYKSAAPRNSREIGQQLGVAHLLEGSVQRAANKIRVTTQLIDARTDTHEWAENYDRPVDDVFAIQSEIAKAIADQLEAKLSPSEKRAIDLHPTKDLAAFDLYTRAKNLVLTSANSGMGKADLLQAIALLNQALMRDPSFFDAYCQLADAHGQLYLFGFDHTSERLRLGETAVEAASRLRPEAGETHLARARNLYQGHRDYAGALTELELARQTLPNNARVYQLMGFIQRRQAGRYEEATRTLEHAIELDPRDFLTLTQIAAFNYPRLRRFADAKSAWDRAIAIQPDDLNAQLGRAGVEVDWRADTRPLHQTLDTIRARNPGALSQIANNWLGCALAERDAAAAKAALAATGEDALNLGSENVHFPRAFVEGLIARMSNDDAAARSAFTVARAEQEKLVAAQPGNAQAVCVLGLIDAGLGRKEEAIREGRRALEILPVERELEGLDMTKYFAVIAAWVGEKDLACEQLAIAVNGPSSLTYGELKLLPLWDPLRGDPRFEKIVRSLTPQ